MDCALIQARVLMMKCWNEKLLSATEISEHESCLDFGCESQVAPPCNLRRVSYERHRHTYNNNSNGRLILA